MSLDLAPDHIKLAVDLIELLESHEIDPNVAVDALTIVLRDFQEKQNKCKEIDSEIRK
jgi:hypothetical protein